MTGDSYREMCRARSRRRNQNSKLEMDLQYAEFSLDSTHYYQDVYRHIV